MNIDAVVVGAILTVAGGVIVIGFLAYKVTRLMKQDEETRASKK